MLTQFTIFAPIPKNLILARFSSDRRDMPGKNFSINSRTLSYTLKVYWRMLHFSHFRHFLRKVRENDLEKIGNVIVLAENVQE